MHTSPPPRYKVDEVAAELGIPTQVLRDRLRGVGINCARRGPFSLAELMNLQPAIYAAERRRELEEAHQQAAVALAQQKASFERRIEEVANSARSEGAAAEQTTTRARLSLLIENLVRALEANQNIGAAPRGWLTAQLRDLPNAVWWRPLTVKQDLPLIDQAGAD